MNQPNYRCKLIADTVGHITIEISIETKPRPIDARGKNDHLDKITMEKNIMFDFVLFADSYNIISLVFKTSENILV